MAIYQNLEKIKTITLEFWNNSNRMSGSYSQRSFMSELGEARHNLLYENAKDIYNKISKERAIK